MPHILLTGDVNKEMIDKCLVGLMKAADDKSVDVWLCTEGGEFYAGLAIYDLLSTARSQGKTIRIFGFGAVMSAGAIIMQAGSRRYITSLCQVMVHYGDEGADNKEEARQNERMYKKMVDIFMDRVTVSRRTVNKWMDKDAYFTADRAVKIGLADKVIGT